MSDVKLKRYSQVWVYGTLLEELKPIDRGEWVRYEDVEKLESENRRLREALELSIAYQLECHERLRVPSQYMIEEPRKTLAEIEEKT